MKTPGAKDVVLLCNPQAGGRWRGLAEVLDSEEAQHVRRIVTDEIDDVREAIAGVGKRVKLLLIYGGDGTIFHVLAELLKRPDDVPPQIALLGGGTMNVTAGACGMSRSPGENFRHVMRAYLADRLLWKEVPLVAVGQGRDTNYGFTFGVGPLVRILERFESGSKSHLSAVGVAMQSAAGAISSYPRAFAPVVQELRARVIVDDQELPFDRFAALFCNVTGVINPFVTPFVSERGRDRFHFLAYAVSPREFAIMAPLLARGRLPMDPASLLRPVSTWRQALLSLVGEGNFPFDPRYVNHPAHHVVIHTEEKQYTLDGELLPIEGGRVEVRLGPPIRLALLGGRRDRVRASKVPGSPDVAAART